MNPKQRIARKLIELARELGIDFKRVDDIIDSIRVISKYNVFDSEASRREKRECEKVLYDLSDENNVLIKENEALIKENELLKRGRNKQ